MNTNPQAITFDNGRARPMADIIYSAYLSAKKLQQEWNAQSVATVIPNDATVIGDGAATDGRPQITNAQVTNIVTRSGELINWLETGSLAGGTVTNSFLNTVLAAEVNGKSQF